MRSVSLIPFLVLFVVLGSGAVVFLSNSHLTLAILVFIVFLQIVANQKTIRFNIKYFSFLIILWFAILISMGLNDDLGKLASYLNLAVRIFIPFIIPLILSFEEFVRFYSKIINFLAISSLIIFTVLIVLGPSVYSFFPKTVNLTGQEYVNMFIFVIFDNGAENSTITRNASLFWEPGAFQGFLTLGLILEIFYYKLRRKKIIALLIITSLTTVSTTGYIILLILFAMVIVGEASMKINKYFFLFGVPLILACIVWGGPLIITSILEKFSEGHQSSFIRIVSTITDLTLFSNSIYYGLGLSGYLDKISDTALQLFSLELGGSTNSLTYHLAIYGLLFVIPLLLIYLTLCKFLCKDIKRATVVFVVLILTFSTENFLTSLLWLTLGFYGIHSFSKRKPESKFYKVDGINFEKI
jgi:hypothetical protein